MDDDAAPELRKTPKVRAYITAEAQAIVCYLRLHPSVAKTYGIKVDGNTSVGSMLMQTLCAQGAGVDWHNLLPDGAHGQSRQERKPEVVSIHQKDTHAPRRPQEEAG